MSYGTDERTCRGIHNILGIYLLKSTSIHTIQFRGPILNFIGQKMRQNMDLVQYGLSASSNVTQTKLFPGAKK